MTILDDQLVAPVFDLARYGAAPAIIDGDRVLSYAELDDLVDQRCARLGSARRLVLLECANELEPLVTYLAALRGHHPVLLVPQLDGEAARRHHERLVASYDPDVCVTRSGSRTPGNRPADWTLEIRREQSAHELHPELAVLLGTSGSTGTPKLVRLSRDNLAANAAAIAGFLGLDASSRAATTLPFQYCFGLSVVNSHLIAGGSLWLTRSSVVDIGFWDGFAAAGATSFAGVPYTFELLERSGVDWLAQPGLRQVLQAGGRMQPARVRAIGERAAARAAELFVMYGQTEATARMAYLPPHLATARPDCVGIPIEGGEFRIDPSAGSGRRDGELVYSGANVMLGYAETPADLALGRTVTELRTGDLARQHDDGLFEIVGRCNRLAKLYGVRLDLDRAERMLAEHDVQARLVASSEQLRAFVLDPGQVDEVAGLLVAEHCLPAYAVAVHHVEDFPRTTNGKVDYAALDRFEGPVTVVSADVRAAFAGVFGRQIDLEDTFVSLGGDSLYYVETYVRLERLLGEVPPDWPHLTVAELSSQQVKIRRRWASLEVPVLLRAVAILLVVGSHTELWDVMGGAHTLLVLCGYAMARFALSAPTRRERLFSLGRSVRELVVPAVLVVGASALLFRTYDWPAVLLVNNWLGPDSWALDWQLWFLESATWTTVALAALVAVPATDRLIARFPFASALVALATTLVVREVMHHVPATTLARYSLERTAWLVALGWLIQAARTRQQRWLVTAVVPLSVLGFFGDNRPRELLIIAGALALLWVRHVPVPRPLDRCLALVASASLFIYLTHWHVYPHLERDHQLLAALASLTVGTLAWWGYITVRRVLRQDWAWALHQTRGPNVQEGDKSGVPSMA